MFTGIDNIGIGVSNLDQAVEFYEQLGTDVDVVSETEAMVTFGDASTYLYIFETTAAGTQNRTTDLQTNPPGADHISISVESVDETHTELVEREIPFVLDPVTDEEWGLRMAAVVDPDGTHIYFVKQN